MKRLRRIAVWLAIAALLSDGMLPTALSAATRPAPKASAALCNAASGIPAPAKQSPSLPVRHCALCAACFVALLPGRAGELSARLPLGPAHPGARLAVSAAPCHVSYAAAQPRAPPAFA